MTLRYPIPFFLFAFLTPAAAPAQEHRGHAPADTAAATPEPDHAPPSGEVHGMGPGVLGEPRTREGSGTGWLPDDSPMYAFHRMVGPWELMLHGSAAIHLVSEGGDRGETEFDATNWVMGMARHPAAGGSLLLRAMASLDPLTAGECGYPDLLATGEFCHGEPLVDRQHPHDAIMEIAAGWERAVSEDLAVQLYAGLAGEPALGPVAFPHRISALSHPLAPITHHWLDSTHITFGVVTAGVYGRSWKLEGSAFNGREPDEERYDLDLAALESWSGRLSWLPNERWALQASHGQLEEAEMAHDGEGRIDVTRTTASATHHHRLASGGHWASTAAWGRNEEEGHATHALLVETNLNLAQSNVLFARLEVVEKSNEDLRIEHDGAGSGDELHTVSKLALTYVRQLPALGGLVPGVGGGISVNFLPEDLEEEYGTTTPVGLVLFARLRPPSAPMDHAEPGMEHAGNR